MGHVAVAEPLQDDPDVALRFGFVQKQLRIGRQVFVDLRGRPQKKRKEKKTQRHSWKREMPWNPVPRTLIGH